jgi:hypothetical protein
MALTRRTRAGAALAAVACIGGVAAPSARASALAGAQFLVGQATEARLTFRASAPGADWARRDHEAALLELQVDGKVVGEVVAAGGARPSTYRVALGRVPAGRHIVSIWLDARRSSSAVKQAVAGKLRVTVEQPDDRVARYAPILYGRDLPGMAGRYENNHTDAPLLGYHTTTRHRGERTTFTYWGIWSGADAATDPDALLARTGRTADDQWIYRVTLDKRGRKLADAYQGPDHTAVSFAGARERHHPLLKVATDDNTVAPLDPADAGRHYRFPLDFSRTPPRGRPSASLMDASPWTYAAMAGELAREGKLESPAAPGTAAVSDLRDYLFAEVTKTTSYAAAPAAGNWVGVALEAQLEGGGQWYSSAHGTPDWSLESDDPAATAIELPPGTTRSDIHAVRVVAVPVGKVPAGYKVAVSALRGGFLLGRNHLPGKPLLDWSGKVTLSAATPAKVLWRASAGS